MESRRVSGYECVVRNPVSRCVENYLHRAIAILTPDQSHYFKGLIYDLPKPTHTLSYMSLST
jgi:hypothetical protein